MRGSFNDTIERVARSRILLKAALPSLLFLAAGALAALAIRTAGASVRVHFSLLWAAALFSIFGAWAERAVLRIDGAARGPVHRLVIGQIVLVLYFYLRSSLSHAFGAPGVHGWEIHLLAGAALVHLMRLRRGEPGREEPARLGAHSVVWVLFWASAFAYVGQWSGRLETPSSDPDVHAFLAKLTAQAGRIIYDHAPVADGRVGYPSAFSVLNALWMDLSGASAVHIVNCQTALQSSFAVGLVLETILALRAGSFLAPAVVFLGVAHWLFALPVNPDWLFLEGTPRLAHKAMAILPLSLAVRLAASCTPARRLRAAGILIGAFCLCWAIVTNPAHLFVQAPILLGSLAVVLAAAHPAPAHPDRGRQIAWTCAAAVAFSVLLLASDAWIRSLVSPETGNGLASNALASGLNWSAALEAGWSQATSQALLGLFPHGCMISAQCPPYLALPARTLATPLYIGAGAVLFLLARRAQPSPRDAGLRVAAVAILAVAIALWASFFAFGFAPALLAGMPGLFGSLFRSYSRAGLAYSTALLFLCLLGAALPFVASAIEALLSTTRPRLAARADALVGGAAALALLLAAAANPRLVWQLAEAHARNVQTVEPSSAGPVASDDLRLVEQARALVPSDERVLLPGVVQTMNEWETWYFTLGGARAVPLYSDLKFAFFHAVPSGEFTPQAYQEHVCAHFDPAWLAERRIFWIYDGGPAAGPFCVHDWKTVRERDFEERLRVGDRALLRLRRARLPQVVDRHPG